MKKLLAALLAACLLILSACGGQTDTESLAYTLAGLDPQATLLTVNGREVSAELYLYWLQYACSVAENTGAVDEEGNPVIFFPAGTVTDEANGEQSFRIPKLYQ